jgi:uncharacterized protein
MFLFQCPHCRHSFYLEGFDPNRSVSCPHCGSGESPIDPAPSYSQDPATTQAASPPVWDFYEPPLYDGKPLPQPELDGSPPPYGVFSTLGISFLMGLVLVAAQSAPVALWVLLGTNFQQPDQEKLLAITQDGDMIAVAAWSSAIVGFFAFWLVASLKQGWSGLPYLAFSKFHPLHIPIWIIAYIGFIIFLMIVVPFLPGLPDESLDNALRTSTTYPIFVISALVIAAPLVEEVFFRGFLYRGLAASPLGPIGAILIGSFVWAMIHVNYEFPQLFTLFILGLLLGVARWKSKSIWPCIGIHAANNLLASIALFM